MISSQPAIVTAAQSPRGSLARLFNVLPGEGRLVILLGVFAFAMTLSGVVTQAAGFGLFLGAFGSQDLPFVYMGTALAATLVAFAYLRLAGRLPLGRLLAIDAGFLVVGSVALRLGLIGSPPRWLLFFLPIWFQVVINLAFLAIWALAGRVFDVQQGKRVFGLVNAGYWLAWVVGGFLVPFLVTALGIANLLAAAALAALIGLGVELLIVRLYPSQLNVPVERTASGPTLADRDSGARRYVRLIFALTVCLWVGLFVIDNLFYNRAVLQFPRADRLASVVGVLGGAGGIVALCVSTVVTRPFMSRYGIRAALLIMPVLVSTIVAGLAAVSVLGGPLTAQFDLAALAKLLNVALTFSVQVTAIIILYQPLSPLRRVQVQTMADGIVQPLAIGLTGVLLLLFRVVFAVGPVFLSCFFLVLVGIWIPTVLALVRQYPHALARALARRRLAELPPLDEESVALLRRELESPYPDAVLYALRLLVGVPGGLSGDVVIPLLEHPSAAVREEALREIERVRLQEARSAVARRVTADPAAEVRGAAARVLVALDGALTTGSGTTGYLPHCDEDVRYGAMLGLARHGGVGGAETVLREVNVLAASADPALRILATRLLGELDLAVPSNELSVLMRDGDAGVRRAAVKAIGRRKDGEQWPEVVAALADPTIRAEATDALLSGGDDALQAIGTALAEGANRDVLLRLIRIAGRIGGERAIELLFPLIAVPDAHMRTQALAGLSACGFVAGTRSPAVRQQIAVELGRAGAALKLQTDLGSHEPFVALTEALEDSVRGSAERVLYLLSFLYDSAAMLRVRDALRSGSERSRAYALELLETLLPTETRSPVLSLVRHLSPGIAPRDVEGQAGRMVSAEDTLLAILSDRSGAYEPWVVACALYTVGLLRADRCRHAVAHAIDSADSLVREMACWALTRIEPGSRAPLDSSLYSGGGHGAMLSTIEKAIILKTAGIFAETPDSLLAEVAAVVEEVEIPAGCPIVEKGEPGDGMYILVSGKVRVHDGDYTLSELGPRAVFGEMAVLTREPRSASVTALDDAYLLRLPQEPFYEIMADRADVARAIIHVISERLRVRSEEVARLSARVEELERAANAV